MSAATEYLVPDQKLWLSYCPPKQTDAYEIEDGTFKGFQIIGGSTFLAIEVVSGKGKKTSIETTLVNSEFIGQMGIIEPEEEEAPKPAKAKKAKDSKKKTKKSKKAKK